MTKTLGKKAGRLETFWLENGGKFYLARTTHDATQPHGSRNE